MSPTNVFVYFILGQLGENNGQKKVAALLSDQQTNFNIWAKVWQNNPQSITNDLKVVSIKAFLGLPCTAKTLQGWVPWRDDSLFPPLMKAGRLGLLWSPTNFPGCCPIRAGCQAAAGTLQAALSCSPCKSGPPGREGIGRRKRPCSLTQSVLRWGIGVGGLLCGPVILQ